MNDVGNDCLVSVDGTDVLIQEQSPWSRMWYSHKFKGPGLRYEVALSIRTGLIVWLNGPFPCGSFPDLKIFRNGLQGMLGQFERVEADAGYVGCDPEYAKTPQSRFGSEDRKELQNRVRARQETVNKRFKQFSILNQRFRHDLSLHVVVFDAVAVITQLSILSGESLFEITDYID